MRIIFLPKVQQIATLISIMDIEQEKKIYFSVLEIISLNFLLLPTTCCYTKCFQINIVLLTNIVFL